MIVIFGFVFDVFPWDDYYVVSQFDLFKPRIKFATEMFKFIKVVILSVKDILVGRNIGDIYFSNSTGLL